MRSARIKRALLSLAWLMTLVLTILSYNRYDSTGRIDGLHMFVAVITLSLMFVIYHHNKEREELG